MEMTKWFDTNYHYIVPEFCEGQKFTFASAKVVNEFQEALSLGIKTSLFCLEVYLEVLQRLASAQAEWVQFDEPALALDLTSAERRLLLGLYSQLVAPAPTLKFLVATSVGEISGATTIGTRCRRSANLFHAYMLRH
ncbi:MAG TPA: hypothetical protein VK775_01945 [Chthoniobacterales bacterium]|jgi:5-methyltetrahydropteroyltriglutamate--homocysteine methyltransferase|nr:hypothetical protein [Chthoniobacterales bacterium]